MQIVQADGASHDSARTRTSGTLGCAQPGWADCCCWRKSGRARPTSTSPEARLANDTEIRRATYADVAGVCPLLVAGATLGLGSDRETNSR
jgi:hypothetical protein